VPTLFDSAQRSVATNTRWSNAPNAAEIRLVAPRVGAFALPENSADSVVLAKLAPGAYTAQTAGANNTAGVALVEIYDADATAGAGTSRLINTAVRAQVGTGANVLIPGLVVSDGAPKTVLIRAVGPTLASFGVAGALAEPVVSLFAGAESFLTHRGWANASNASRLRPRNGPGWRRPWPWPSSNSNRCSCASKPSPATWPNGASWRPASRA
jgi:hypothetical protein